MEQRVCLNQGRRILRVVGALLAVAACCAILVAAPDNGKVGVAAASAARNTAVWHMNRMGTTRWIPQNSTWYINTGTGKTDDYIKSNTYKGMPYSQWGLNQWYQMSAKLTPVYPNASLYYCSITAGFTYLNPQSFGNDCAKAVFQSWKQAGSPMAITGVNTLTMLQAVQSSSSYMEKVGSYASYPASTYYSTWQMTNSASEKINVQAAYELLQPGDSLFYRYTLGGEVRGHAITVRSVNVATKTVYFIDQIGSGSYISDSQPAGWRLDFTFSTWRVSSMTFEELYNSHYVPVTANFSGW